MSRAEQYYDEHARRKVIEGESILVGAWLVTGPDGNPIDEGGQSRVFLLTKEEALVRAHSCAKHNPGQNFFVCQQRALVYGVVDVKVEREDFK